MKTLGIIGTLVLFVQLGYSQVLVERESSYDPNVFEKSEKKVEKKKQPSSETIFNNERSFGAYVSTSAGIAEMDGNMAFVSGGRLMFVTNHILGIGFGGKGFVTNPSERPYVGTDPDINTIYSMRSGGYGGLYVEPVVASLKPVHLSFPILIGAGAVAETKWDDTFWDDSYYYEEDYYGSNSAVGSVFMIVEPGVELEFNVAKWLRFTVGGAYRFTSEINGISSTTDTPMDGWSVDLGLKVGWF